MRSGHLPTPHLGGAAAEIRTHVHSVETRLLSVAPELPVPATDEGTNMATLGPMSPRTASIFPGLFNRRD